MGEARRADSGTRGKAMQCGVLLGGEVGALSSGGELGFVEDCGNEGGDGCDPVPHPFPGLEAAGRDCWSSPAPAGGEDKKTQPTNTCRGGVRITPRRDSHPTSVTIAQPATAPASHSTGLGP